MLVAELMPDVAWGFVQRREFVDTTEATNWHLGEGLLALIKNISMSEYLLRRETWLLFPAVNPTRQVLKN